MLPSRFSPQFWGNRIHFDGSDGVSKTELYYDLFLNVFKVYFVHFMLTIA